MPTELKVYKKQRPAVSIFKGTPPFKGKAKKSKIDWFILFTQKT